MGADEPMMRPSSSPNGWPGSSAASSLLAMAHGHLQGAQPVEVQRLGQGSRARRLMAATAESTDRGRS